MKNGVGSKLNKSSVGEIYQKYGIFLIMIIVFLGACIANPNFLKASNLTNVMKQITAVAVIAAGETILLVSGCIDLSASAVAAVSSCFAANALLQTNSVIVCFAVAMLIGIVLNYISGSMITWFKLPPFIATLAIMSLAEGMSYLYSGGKTIKGLDKLKWLSQGKLFDFIPNMLVLLALVLILMQFMLKRTRLGLYMYAIGGNLKASIAAGINVNRILRLTYVINGALVGIAGLILTSRMMAATPNITTGGYEFDAITATVVGGTSFSGGHGSMFNVIVGAIIVGIINNVMILMGLDSNWQTIAKGLLIAVAVIIDINTKKSNK
ncbi:ABC transporter permease [Butyricicoccus faecihominis]|uniref:ABC transporter permease n=1 Tax=Butyricicoccaceae TaxID=3085642 RepID=UPI00247990F8|nr:MULTISPECIES: ABC transporter permease [Butyricicoccaceae]MCQ5130134.1 ABC transporter permease [Butyricicoccus faecihominis]WNX83440.1 ABC transporter permease [Agathobaculum sp. NTUH-O15-33]